MEENSERICIQHTTEYFDELKSLMETLTSELSKYKGKRKRSILDRLPSNLVEEILLVLDKKSKQPAEVRKFLTWLNAQVVIRVVSKIPPKKEIEIQETGEGK